MAATVQFQIPTALRRGDLNVSNKEIVIEAIRQLPEQASFEEIVEEIAILAAIQKGERDADAGRMIPHDDVKKRLSSWISK
jgi:predicted transcriptional regulator